MTRSPAGRTLGLPRADENVSRFRVGFQFHFDPDVGFYTSPVNGGDDWTVVRLRPNENGTAHAQFEFMELAERSAANGESVHIIQHPEGRPQESSSGKIIEPPDRRILYDAESQGGSSGTPVFNRHEQIIALHLDTLESPAPRR